MGCRTAVLVVFLVGVASQSAIADGVHERASAIRGGFSAEVYAFERHDGVGKANGGGGLSITSGDGRGADFEMRFTTQILVSLLEAGARVYLVDERVYARATVGCGFLFVIPSDIVVSAGLGVALLQDSTVELEIGAFIANGEIIADETQGRGLRSSIGIRF